MDRTAVEAITRLIFVPDRPVKADFTIVLGMSLWQRPVACACGLYRQGLTGKLIFTGGHNDRLQGTEGEAMLAGALAAGIAPADAICENRATHTRENMELSWRLMQAAQADVRAVNLIAIHHHLPRALLSARAVLPGHVRLGHVSYPSIHFDSGNWHDSARGRKDVLAEFEKLKNYFPDAIGTDFPSVRP